MAALLSLAGSPPARAAGFGACLGELRGEARAKGISARTFDTAMSGVEPDQSVLDAMAYQPEFELPIWDYLAALVDDERIADGRARLAEWAPVLERAEREFGVDRHAIVAVWGVETDYGRVPEPCLREEVQCRPAPSAVVRLLPGTGPGSETPSMLLDQQ